ncbi:MAG: hypothetical protein HZB91_05290 [Elusimicrobia bacterium]|nr:hypothetical protein [Elusimicrobiota bacterium]
MNAMQKGRKEKGGLAPAACAAGACAALLCLAVLKDPRLDGPRPAAYDGGGQPDLHGPYAAPGRGSMAAPTDGLSASGKARPEEPSSDIRDAMASVETARFQARLTDEPAALSEWWLLAPRAGSKAATQERRLPGWTASSFGHPAPSRPSAALTGIPPREASASSNEGTGHSMNSSSSRPAAAPLEEKSGSPWTASRQQSRPPDRTSGEAGRGDIGTAFPGLPPKRWSRAGPRSASRQSAKEAGAGPAKKKTLSSTVFRAPAFKPILLSKLLGKNAIRPPKGKIAAPDLSSLPARMPAVLPDGRPFQPEPPEPEGVEALEPPDPKAWSSAGTCPKNSHWHRDSRSLHYHDDEAWGLWQEGRWTWHVRKGARWWVSAGPKIPTLLRHGRHWWWQASDLWFLLHQGQPWGYRQLTELGLDSLVHPASGTAMVYSEDGTRLALITPGQGAVLFDAETGAVLGRWTESEMPKPRKPKAPTSLTFPR